MSVPLFQQSKLDLWGEKSDERTQKMHFVEILTCKCDSLYDLACGFNFKSHPISLQLLVQGAF